MAVTLARRARRNSAGHFAHRQWLALTVRLQMTAFAAARKTSNGGMIGAARNRNVSPGCGQKCARSEPPMARVAIDAALYDRTRVTRSLEVRPAAVTVDNETSEAAATKPNSRREPMRVVHANWNSGSAPLSRA